jgi:Xaa-Pro aminopeptidase
MAAKGQTRAKTAQKLSRLRALMQARGLDGVVHSSYQNVSYFGGTTVITQVLVPDRLGFLVARRDGAVS